MKVSVIIPVYNVENYIRECVFSVTNQTLDEIEIICVNDAGTDNSWEIVREIATMDNRIVLLENAKNAGLAATRNKGLDIAKGEYVYFLDADDMITPNALEMLYSRAVKEALEVQIFAASFIYENAELEEKFKNNPRVFKQEYPDVISGRELFIKWMEVWDWMPSQPRFFYNREFLNCNKIRYTEGMLHEDEIFAFEVLEAAKRVRVTQDEFFIRRFRQASIMTGGPNIKNVEGCIKILDRVKNSLNADGSEIEWNKAVDFYMYKIFKDATRKYRLAYTDKKLDKPMISALSDEIKNDAVKMNIFHMIESFGLWEEI